MAVTYLNVAGDIEGRLQFSGRVLAVSPLVAIERGSGEDPFTPPPDPDAFERAKPGVYTLETGEILVDPDFVTTWTVEASAGDQ